MTDEKKLSMPYVFWRFLYWAKTKNLTYTQIDEMVDQGKIIPSDDQVANKQEITS